VVYEDGTVWEYRPETGWVTVASMTGEVPTVNTPQSWGHVKDRYRR
jgi:hypothetical protein